MGPWTNGKRFERPCCSPPSSPEVALPLTLGSAAAGSDEPGALHNGPSGYVTGRKVCFEKAEFERTSCSAPPSTHQMSCVVDEASPQVNQMSCVDEAPPHVNHAPRAPRFHPLPLDPCGSGTSEFSAGAIYVTPISPINAYVRQNIVSQSEHWPKTPNASPWNLDTRCPSNVREGRVVDGVRRTTERGGETHHQ